MGRPTEDEWRTLQGIASEHERCEAEGRARDAKIARALELLAKIDEAAVSMGAWNSVVDAIQILQELEA